MDRRTLSRQLEAGILTRNAKKVAACLHSPEAPNELGFFLGLAVRFSAPEIVAVLLRSGADFTYTDSELRQLFNGWGSLHIRFSQDNHAQCAEAAPYEMILDTSGYLGPMDWRFAYAGTQHARTDGSVLANNLRMLSAARIGFDPGLCLLLAICEKDRALLSAFELAGMAHFPEGPVKSAVTKGDAHGSELLNQLQYQIAHDFGTADAAELAELSRQLCEAAGTRAYFAKKSFRSYHAAPEYFSVLRKYTTCVERVPARVLLPALMKAGNYADFVSVLGSEEFFSEQAYRDLNEAADCSDDPAIYRAAILEHQKSLGISAADSDRFSLELRQCASNGPWRFSVCEDGALLLTVYQGTLADVAVPGEICGMRVHAVHPNALRARFQRLSYEAQRARAHLESLAIPGTIATVPARIFRGCTISKLTLGEGVREIADNAVAGLESWRIIRGLAGEECALEQVCLPESLWRIGAYAFSDAPIGEIALPPGLLSFGQGAFLGCLNLTEIHIPEGICEIPPECFEKSGLKRIAFPPAVKRVREFAFYGCEALEEVILTASTERIDCCAFAGCPNLRIVRGLPDGVLVSRDAFCGISEECVFLP